MRNLFTLYCLLTTFFCYSQSDTLTHTVNQGVFAGRPKLSCMRTLTGKSDPLIVLNGIPDTSLRITSIKYFNINKTDTLSSAAATAIYGPDGANGAILVTTRSLNFRKFVIKDSIDGSPVAGATVSFTSAKNRNETFQYLANDSGVVVADKLNRFGKYQMVVSSVGYKTFYQGFEYQVDLKKVEIFLVREIKVCEEVIVSSIHGFGCCLSCSPSAYRQEGSDITNTWYCKFSGITIRAGTDKNEQFPVETFEFKVYPNPVQRSSPMNLQFDTRDGKRKIVRIITLDGRILLQQSFNTSRGKNLFQIPTDVRWSAGIYVVQLLYENGQVAASEKVILQ